MKLELAVVRIDGDTQARVGLDQDVVAEYALAMQDGDKFPVMVAFHDGSDYWLADGFHRFFARKANGELEAEFDVKQGTQRDALLYSFGANGIRGLKLTAEDIRNIITRMLQDEEWRSWSDVQIAKHVGCSSMTVGRVRHTLEEAGKVTKKTTTKYVDKNGKTKEMKTGTKPKKEKPKADPDLEDKLSELTDTITQLHDENTLLKDKIAIGQWDATEIEKIDAEQVIADLRQQINVLEMENKSLRDSRDMFQNRNAELMRTVKALTNKLKKAGIE
jgi:DNA-binding transcriptional regulator YhcF (GntR family)